MTKQNIARKFTRTFRPCLESLESRLTPSTFTVANLSDSGEGSLRQAILDANSLNGPDVIDFSVAGTIRLTSGALPAIVDQVKLDGRSAPGFAGAPVVEIDNNGFAGLSLGGSTSTIASLSIVNAERAGVTLGGGGNTLVGNYIGLALDGSTAGNSGPGLLIDGSYGDTIGGRTELDRNVISGNGGDGILVGPSGQVAAAFIINNYIGTDPSGQSAASNQGNGIALLSNGNNIGSFSGYGNTIAFNKGAGVLVDGGTSNSIQSNAIFSNGDPGIRLVNNGNLDLAAPQLSYAVVATGSTPGAVNVRIGGILNTQPGIPTVIQVFATRAGVPAGQGQIFLGFVQVYPNANGLATFTLSATVPNGVGATFTATASNTTPNSNSTSNTSAFSNSVGASTPNQVYVGNAYQLLLSRAPDASASVWVNALNSGVSAAGVILGIESSTEYLNGQVRNLYRYYLHRNADLGGEQAWTNVLQTGGTLEQVAAGLIGSDEFYVLNGGTNPGFVLALYYDVFGRLPNDNESARWILAVNGGVSRVSVAGAFLTSQEYRSNLVGADYRTSLQRQADPFGIATFVNALNAGATDQQVLAAIFGSPEGYRLWS
jgi:hypothetical protein